MTYRDDMNPADRERVNQEVKEGRWTSAAILAEPRSTDAEWLRPMYQSALSDGDYLIAVLVEAALATKDEGIRARADEAIKAWRSRHCGCPLQSNSACNVCAPRAA